MNNKSIQERLRKLTPEQLAKLKATVTAQKAPSKSPPEANLSVIHILPEEMENLASFGQRRIWMLERLNEGRTAVYNLSKSVILEGDLNVKALEHALLKLIERHSVLRSVFKETTNGLQSKTLGIDHFRIEMLKLECGGIEPFEAFIKKANTRQFDLQLGPLIRFQLAKIDLKTWGLNLVIHHCVCDGQSIPLLMRELDFFYRNEIQSESTALPALVSCYQDFAGWQRQRLNSQMLKKSQAFWKSQFGSIPEPLEIPTDFPRPSTQSFNGAHYHTSIDKNLWESLIQLGIHEKSTLFTTVLAAFQGFMHRYTGAQDIVVGCPVAGRTHPDLETQVGLFINTLPLRGTFTGEVTFRDFIAQVRDRVYEALEHQEFPFDQIVEQLKLKRDPSRSPLFDVMIGLENAEDEKLSLGDLTVVPIAQDPEVSKVDLTFHFSYTNEKVSLDIEYATSLFSGDRIRRMGDLWIAFLRAITVSPDVPIKSVDWLPAEEKRQVLEHFAIRKVAYPENAGLVELFQTEATAQPEATAVIFDGNSFSYRWLDEQSDRIAYHLTDHHGTLHGNAIGVVMEKSEWMIVTVLGILKAGGCYLPVNADTPLERLSFILKQADVRVVFTDSNLIDGFERIVARWVNIRSKFADPPADWSPRTTGGRDLAYIMFTSGSTGTPKGTLIEQRSVTRLVKSSDFHQIKAGERILQTGALAFDASTFEIWGALLNGGCCILPKGKTLLEIESFGELLESSKVDTMFITTGLFNQLVDLSINSFVHLKTVLTGGEKVSLTHINRLKLNHPNLRLLHVYGPTENTTFSTWYEIREEHKYDVPIGKPIANSEIFILDKNNHLLPIGVPGEIHCGGPGLARGYLNQPDLIDRQFIQHPFSDNTALRLYRTGDLGYWDADGNVIFVGRNDDQVKIRGFRIEPGEIETRLRAHPSIEKAVVIARKQGGTHELISYVVATDTLNAKKLREWLLESLPDYMAPAHFIQMDTLPLNANGKVDRKQLPEVESTETLSTGDLFESPETKAEIALCECLKTILKQHRIGRNDHYFTLGGDSIKAILLGSKLSEWGWKLKLPDVFAFPIIHDLALKLKSLDAKSEKGIQLKESAPLVGSCGFTPIQQWFLGAHSDPFARFNQVTVLKSRKRLNVERISQVLNRWIEHHDALRLCLSGHSTSDFTHEFLPVLDQVECELHDFTQLSTNVAADRFKVCADELQLKIQLGKGNLLAAAVIQMPDADHLVLVIHHWAVDGVSWRILLAHLERLYETPTAELPPKTTSIKDWVSALAIKTEQGGFDHQLEFWGSIVSKIGDKIKPKGRMAQVSFSLDKQATEAFIGQANTTLKTQPNEILLAAFSHAWEQTLHSSLAVAMEGHGRVEIDADLDLSQTVGWFTSMYPLALPLLGQINAIERVKAVKSASRMVSDQGVGFGCLRYGRKHVNLGQLPSVSFNYLGIFDLEDTGLFEGSNEQTGSPIAESLTRDFAMNVVGHVECSKLHVQVQYFDGSFETREMTVLLQNFQRSLNSTIQDLLNAESEFTASDALMEFLDDATFSAWLNQFSVTPQSIESMWQATPMQVGMLLQSQQNDGYGDYCDQVRQWVRGSLDIECFQKTWRIITKRHPALRSGFWSQGLEHPVQVVFKHQQLDLRIEDLSLLKKSVQDKRRDSIAQADREEGFELSKAPLFRMHLLCLGEHSHELILYVHHSILDGWSTSIILNEFLQIYEGLVSGHSVKLEPAVSFEHFIRYQQSLDTKVAFNFWETELSNCPQGTLPPSDQSLWEKGQHEPIFSRHSFGKTLSNRIENAAKSIGTSNNIVMQCLWATWLGKSNGSSDVVFGKTASGRDIPVPSVEKIVGLLINTLPVRFQTAGMSFESLCIEATTKHSQYQTHGQIALADVFLAAQRNDIIRHTFIFENHPKGSIEENKTESLIFETIGVHDPMHFDFGLLVFPMQEGFEVRFVSNATKYSETALQCIFKSWKSWCKTVLEKTGEALESIELPQLLTKPDQWVIAGNFTLEPIKESLEFLANGRSRPNQYTFAGFNQVFQDLLDPLSMLSSNQSGHNLIILKLSEWIQRDESDVDQTIDQFVNAIKTCSSRLPSAQFTLLFAPEKTNQPDSELLALLESRLIQRLESVANIEAVESEIWSKRYNFKADAFVNNIIGAVPYNEAVYAAFALESYRRMDYSTRNPVKVLAVDADNTLWSGIIGEDGIQGISLSDGYLGFQHTLKHLCQNGILLCLVTKNNPSDIEKLFDQRKDMVLKKEDWVAIKASWEPKSVGIQQLAAQLNLGLDSFVFLDDNPMEIAEVKGALPEVRCIRVANADKIDSFAQHLWLLDLGATTEEDQNRSEQYKVQLQRESQRHTAGDLFAFIETLNLEVEIFKVSVGTYDRVVQMSQRTNQFNATGRRLSRAELESWLEKKGHELYLTRVKDRFGDYGICGAMMLEKHDISWDVVNFLLSCRALGRGVEHEMLRFMGRLMTEASAKDLQVHWKRLSRNAPVTQFLKTSSSEFTKTSDEKGVFIFKSDSLQHLCFENLKQNPHVEKTEAVGSLESPSVVFKSFHVPDRFYEVIAHRYGNIDLFLSEVKQSQPKLFSKKAVAYQMPTSEKERWVANIFESVLGVKQVGRKDHFFSLGGHSLKAVMAIGRLQNLYNVKINLDAFLENPIVSVIADKLQAVDSEVSGILVEPLEVAEDYPVSRSQERVWLLNQLRDHAGLAFHMPVALILEGDLNQQAFVAAWQKLQSRHEALRCCFITRNEKPRLKILETLDIPLTIESDLMSEDEFLAEAKLFALRPFDLSQGPLYRILLQPVGESRYGMILVMHHIISDGWSMGVITREFSEAYSAYCKGFQWEPEPLYIQQKEYAHWQDSYLTQSDSDCSFWKQRFVTVPETLNLPTDFARPAIKQSVGGVERIIIGNELARAIRNAAFETGGTVFAWLLGSLQLWLGRYTGTEDICIGTPVAGRSDPLFEPVVGFFVNLIPFRTTVNPDLSVQAFFKQNTDDIRETLTHQQYPFDVLVRDLALERDMSRAPLFDVLFAFQNSDMGELELTSLKTNPVEIDFQGSQYDLAFNVFESSENFNVRLEYDSSLFAKETIAHMLQSWKYVLTQILENQAESVATIKVLTPKMEQRLFAYEQRFQEPSLNQTTIYQLGIQSVLENESKTAIIDEKSQLSYQALFAQSKQLAMALRNRIGKDCKHVAFFGERDVEWVVSMLAIMRAGYVYIPLDMYAPADRLRFQLDDCEAACLLVNTSGAEKAKQLEYDFLTVSDLLVTPHEGSSHGLPDVKSNAPAYMIYTSGTTGRPKGVVVSHQAFSSMIIAQIEAFGVQSDDVCGQFASMAFDASLSEIFLSLATGATLAIANESVKSDQQAFLTWLKEQTINVLTLPPAFLRVLGKTDFSPLRVLITAGESPDKDLALFYAGKLDYFNAYGPTETSVCATVHRVSEFDKDPAIIGRPLKSTIVSILDESGERVPPGRIGEICISGPTLADGYWDRETLTKEAFVETSTPAEGRYYRSGDLGKWTIEGELEFHGRRDDQIKIRGYRIEKGEIEQLLKEHVKVEDACILVYESSLCASYIGSVSADELKYWVENRVPKYMVPNHWLSLENFPVTTNGKIDQKALLTRAKRELQAHGRNGTLPNAGCETTVALIWEEVLKTETVFRESNFFQLGGDSIKALQMISRLNAEGYRSLLKDLFQFEYLKDFTETVVALDPLHEDVLKTVEDERKIPLSPIQKFFFETHPESPWGHFNMAVKLKTNRPLNPQHTRTVIQLLLKKHPVLRSVFPLNEIGERICRVMSPQEIQPEFMVCEGGSDITFTGPFLIEEGPLIRFILDGNELRMVAHHLVIDWISWRQIQVDFASLYEAIEKSNSLTIRSDWGFLERSLQLHSWKEKHVADRSYWETFINTVPNNTEPPGRYRDAHLSEITLSEAISTQWKKIGRESATILLASFSKALFQVLDLPEVCILMESHGRQNLGQEIEYSSSVGWFTSLFPIRIQAPSDPSSLMSVARTAIKSVPNEGLGYGIWTELDTNPLPRVSPLASLNYLGYFDDPKADSELFQSIESGLPGTISDTFERDHPIDLSVWFYQDRLHAVLACSRMNWNHSLQSALSDALSLFLKHFSQTKAYGEINHDDL